jgi:hypothetical protein
MDYTTSINDADNPAGASPWGSSPVASPRHVRNSSYGNSGEPPSPTPHSTNQAANGGFARGETIAGGGYNRPESSTGTGSATDSESHRPDTAESTHQTQSEQSTAGQQASIQQYQQHRSEPQRYHSGARHTQQQQPQGPQYKLQAKITGLERTGRKDPILRFDVHVGTC